MFTSRSQFFRDMISVLLKEMMFKTGHPFYSLFLWVVLPLTITTVVGWYIEDCFSS
jgi:hypothetical protein